MRARSKKEDPDPPEVEEQTQSRLHVCEVLSLFCKAAFLSFGCAWVIFLMLFGTGKLFNQVKAADSAVTFRDPAIG